MPGTPRPSFSLAAPLPTQLLRLWLALVLGMCGVALWWHTGTGLNNDHLGLLRATRMMLQGNEPYLDYAEINPPLITLLYALPTLLSQSTGMPIAMALHLFTILLIALSLTATYRILRLGGHSPAAAQLVAGALAMALCVVSFISDVFADRTHLITLLYAPFLAWCSPLPAPRGVPRRWSLAAAFMAALAITLKPHYATLYIATLVARLWRTRSISSVFTLEDILIPGVLLAYLLLIALFFPYYFVVIVPLSIISYAHLGWSWPNRVFMLRTVFLQSYGAPVLLALAGALALPPRRLPPGILYLLGLCAAGAASYAISSGWWYEHYPYSALAFVTAACLCACLIRRPFAPLRLVVLGLTVALLVNSYVVPSYSRAQMDRSLQQLRGYPWANVMPAAGALSRIEFYLKQYPKFMLLDTTLFGEAFVYAGQGRTHISRFDFLWPIPGLAALQSQNRKPAVTHMLVGYVAGGLAHDLNRHRPPLLMVDVSPMQRGLPPSYNLLAIPLQDPLFAAAFAAYERVESVNDCQKRLIENCAYDFYLRKPGM